jgi:hypothetical protein
MIRLGIAAMIALSVPASAQWLHYPTPGIPRTADGKPDLSAPAPRTASGKPDFSGLWEKNSDKFYNNIVADLPPGAVQPWAEAIYQQRKKDFGKDSMETLCLPDGPAISTTPYRQSRIIQTPALIAILNDDLTHRQIFMDGRELEKDPNPTWMGYSVAHWDGDTLVVESNGFNDRTWLDGDGHPHTEALRITERYHRLDFGHIDLQITLDDAKAYTKPWTVAVKMDLAVDKEMLEFVCENEKDHPHYITGTKALDFKVPVEMLARYAGAYEVPDHGKIVIAEITVEGNNLVWNYNGTGKQRMDPVSETTFSFYGTIVEFVSDEKGVATQMLIKSVEGEDKGVRKK